MCQIYVRVVYWIIPVHIPALMGLDGNKNHWLASVNVENTLHPHEKQLPSKQGTSPKQNGVP